jgi:hypothetical protein
MLIWCARRSSLKTLRAHRCLADLALLIDAEAEQRSQKNNKLSEVMKCWRQRESCVSCNWTRCKLEGTIAVFLAELMAGGESQ